MTSQPPPNTRSREAEAAGERRENEGMSNLKIYGYFTNADQTEPEYDPGLEVACPICHKQLSRPIMTPSLMLEDDNRSYFYRVHKACYESLTPEQETALDSVIIDAVAASKNAN